MSHSGTVRRKIRISVASVTVFDCPSPAKRSSENTKATVRPITSASASMRRTSQPRRVTSAPRSRRRRMWSVRSSSRGRTDSRSSALSPCRRFCCAHGVIYPSSGSEIKKGRTRLDELLGSRTVHTLAEGINRQATNWSTGISAGRAHTLNRLLLALCAGRADCQGAAAGVPSKHCSTNGTTASRIASWSACARPSNVVRVRSRACGDRSAHAARPAGRRPPRRYPCAPGRCSGPPPGCARRGTRFAGGRGARRRFGARSSRSRFAVKVRNGSTTSRRESRFERRSERTASFPRGAPRPGTPRRSTSGGARQTAPTQAASSASSSAIRLP